MEKISYTGQEEADFVEEDSRSEAIKQLTDLEEIKKVQSQFEDKYGEPSKEETLPGNKETSKGDTSKEPTDKTDANDEKPDENQLSDFTLTDEIIKEQPEEDREILSKYKDKPKDELAKAAANAIAMKNELMKGKQKVIDAFAEELSQLPKDKLLEQLIYSQREVGAVEPKPPIKTDKIELPTLPKENEQIEKLISAEVVKGMKKLYPDIPDDFDSVEYNEWERDLQDEKGARAIEKLLYDFNKVENEVKQGMQKVIYAKESLPNIYVESPNEIVPFLTNENIPKLKEINDNFVKINNETLTKEVESIKKELNNFGLKEEDLGISLELKPDSNGSLYNKDLHDLLFDGERLDGNVIQRMGKINLLKNGQLAKKFMQANNTKLLNLIVKSKVERDKGERETLKGQNLANISSISTGKRDMIEKDLTKVTDPDLIKKTLAEIESKY